MKERKPRRAVFLKVVLTALLTASAGLGMLMIYSVRIWPSAQVLRYVWLAALGVVGGFLSRWILGRHTGMLRFFGALFCVSAGLWAAEWVTGGYLGFEILYFDHSYPDYPGLIELGISWLTALLALRAWKRRRPKGVPVPAPVPDPAPIPVPASTKVEPVPVRLVNSSGNLVWIAKLRNVWRTAVGWTDHQLDMAQNWWEEFNKREVTVPLSRRAASEPMISSPPSFRPAVVKPYARTVTNRQRAIVSADVDSEVDEVEHLCPYCLQVVDANDYRGVKVCPVCRAFHHADCWDVTGSCRAPHLRK